jgi:hypothetical protein
MKVFPLGLMLTISLGVGLQAETVDPGVIQKSVLIVEGDSGSGSAFVALAEGKPYIYTNAHVLKGQKKLTFKDSNGKIVGHLGRVEVSEEYDLARLPLGGKPFKDLLVRVAYKDEVIIGEEVTAYRNSGGESVITQLIGAILGVGPSELEIDAGIIPGNSGGPILKKATNVVLAIATRGQAESGPWADDTRFEEIRRFGLRPPEKTTWKKTTLVGLKMEWEKIEKINIDTVSIVALSILTTTQRGLYIPDDLVVGPTGRVSAKRQSTGTRLDRRNGQTSEQNASTENTGKTYVVKAWLSRHRKHGLTSIIWGGLSKVNRALGDGTNKPHRAMVEVKRHYARFFSPLFQAYKRDVADSLKSFSTVHRQDYEAAVSAREGACKLLQAYAGSIKHGIFATGLSGQ